MKKWLFFLTVPALALSLPSCGGESSDGTENADSTAMESSVDFSGMQEVDLSAHNLNTKMMVPIEYSSTGEAYPVDVIYDEDMLSWSVKVGESYDLVIEETDGEGNYLQREKERIGNGVFKVNYLLEKEDHFLYQASLPEGAGQRDYYHFFGVWKFNGMEYLVKSNRIGEFSEVQARDMMKSFLSLQKPNA